MTGDPAMVSRPRAVALLSGGVDSTTAVAIARRDGFAVHALTLRYGQRHPAEIAAARRVARASWGPRSTSSWTSTS